MLDLLIYAYIVAVLYDCIRGRGFICLAVCAAALLLPMGWLHPFPVGVALGGSLRLLWGEAAAHLRALVAAIPKREPGLTEGRPWPRAPRLNQAEPLRARLRQQDRELAVLNQEIGT